VTVLAAGRENGEACSAESLVVKTGWDPMTAPVTTVFQLGVLTEPEVGTIQLRYFRVPSVLSALHW
jgi:hypothetical protein